MGDLPKFTEAFRQKVGVPLKLSALESLRGMTQYSPLQHLSIMKAFLPENLEENLQIFAELSYPGILYTERANTGVKELLEITDYSIPILVFTQKKMNLKTLISMVNEGQKSEAKVIFCGSLSWEKL